jgi:hypothetical protein
MIPRVRSAGIALLAVLATATPCLAAEGMAPGRGAIGGQLGGSKFWADGDYSEGSKPRLAFSGHFRYVINNRFRWQVSPGFTWSGYSGTVAMPVPDGHFPGDVAKRTNLTLLLPMTFEMQYMLHRGKWHYHLGAGPGVYRVWVENRRIVLIDPVSFVKHRKLHAGFTAEIGVERFLKALPSTSVEATIANHWVFAKDDQAYPTGYNDMLAAAELRIGANYYFDMGRLRKKPDQLPPSAR